MRFDCSERLKKAAELAEKRQERLYVEAWVNFEGYHAGLEKFRHLQDISKVVADRVLAEAIRIAKIRAEADLPSWSNPYERFMSLGCKLESVLPVAVSTALVVLSAEKGAEVCWSITPTSRANL